VINKSLISYLNYYFNLGIESPQAMKKSPKQIEKTKHGSGHTPSDKRLIFSEETDRSNTELEQFAFTASHELQAPLFELEMCLKILEEKYQEKSDDDSKELLKKARRGANRMRALIKHFLALARFGSKGVDCKKVSLSVPLRAALRNLKIAIKTAGIKITHEPLPTVYADSEQIAQVFENLISNAIKFCAIKNPQIYISVRHRKGYECVSVRDNGIGFEERYAAQIFEPFKRLHSTDEYPGSGIGLALCKRIVEKHNGKIWAKSKPGLGANFYFTIPDKE
jgi:light-regulated signal transduction histidine kinase (bacteriophytochrome)